MNSEILVDIDGNSYKTIKIGAQTWMCENLRVIHFSNGEPIRIAKNSYECWNGESSVYISSQDTSNYIKYGFLYNYDAMLDQRKLAPRGWRVPTIEDWEELINFLGGKGIAGSKLKNREGWKRKENQPSTYRFRPCEFGGTNESGFTALPSGRMKRYYQNAYDVGMYAWYWAANKKEVGNYAWYGYVNLNYYKGNVDYGCTDIRDYYLAIRCVKE